MKRKPLRIVLILVVIILVLVFIYSASQVFSTVHEYNESSQFYEQTQQHAVLVDVSPSPAPRDSSLPEDPAAELERSPVSVDFAQLRAVSEDVKGWLYSPGTVINYPVVQGENNDYYLDHLMDGTRNPNGSLFIDYSCAADFSDKNTIIYGHHIMDGTMFASIVHYGNPNYYAEHPVMYLNTPDGNYRLDLISGFTTDSQSGVYRLDFESRTEFAAWVEEMIGYSDFHSGVEVGLDDRIVTLSTCTYEYYNARYVLLAKLTPIG